MEKVTNEELAIMINKGFEQTASKEEVRRLEGRMDKFEGRVDHIEIELSHMNARLSTIETDVADIKRDMIHRDEFEDLMGRMKYVELKLGIQSGK